MTVAKVATSLHSYRKGFSEKRFSCFIVTGFVSYLIDLQVHAQFVFIAKLDETEFCKPWLSVKPAMGVIVQGMPISDIVSSSFSSNRMFFFRLKSFR